MKLSPDLVVFITGGASGLGEATARLHLAAGCKVAIADLNIEKMNQMRKELGEEKFIFFKCDVTIEEDVKNAIEGTVAKFGALHVALASAGVMGRDLWLTSKTSINMKNFRKVIDINLMGCVYMAKYASV